MVHFGVTQFVYTDRGMIENLISFNSPEPNKLEAKVVSLPLDHLVKLLYCNQPKFVILAASELCKRALGIYRFTKVNLSR